MNKLNGRWDQFKEELFPILFLSITGIYWCFSFPLYTRLGMPWSIILSICASIISVVSVLYIFLWIEKIAPLFTSVSRIPYIITMHFGFFIVWYKDIYGASNIYYASCAIYLCIFWMLVMRAAKCIKSPAK